MLPILAALGLGSVSVLVGTLFGPAQVASRLFSPMSGNRLQPLSLAIISTGLMSSAIAILLWSGNWLTGALAFTVIFGIGSGFPASHRERSHWRCLETWVTASELDSPRLSVWLHRRAHRLYLPSSCIGWASSDRLC